MASTRDDFTAAVRKSLAHRVGFACSNPGCQAPTAGPSEEAETSRSDVGVAAHITAAAIGGKRYDRSLTADERSSIDNGIWLCQVCAKKIDDDVKTYPVEVLKQWKINAEAGAARRLGRPSPQTNEQSHLRDPLERMIAHRMRDALAAATFPIAMLIPRTVGNEAAYPLSQLMQSPPATAPGSEYLDTSVVRPITSAVVTSKLLEPAVAPSAPPGLRWIDWILKGFHDCAAECDDALRLYSSRGPSILIAQFEVLKRHLTHSVQILSSIAAQQPAGLSQELGRSHLEHTLKVLLRSQRVWLDFLCEWQSRGTSQS